MIISAEIEGIIKDMWLANDRCYFRIEITRSNNSFPEEKIVDVKMYYQNDEAGNYEDLPSSQGWKIGDKINGTLFYQCDENSELYWFKTNSKSDDNYAKPLTSDTEIPIFLYLLIIISTVLILGILIYLFQRIKKKKPTNDRKKMA